jgi:hypothetical protein
MTEQPYSESVALRVLQGAWRAENKAKFGGALRPCFVQVSVMRPWGRWDEGTRTISLSTQLLALGDWLAVREVLLHEMAHQYVTDVLGAAESAHGPVFRQVCEERGIDPRAMRSLEGRAPSAAVQRIEKLLRLSSSSEEHEAQSALATALRLLAREGLHLEDLAPGPDVRVAAWGGARVRWSAHERVLVTRLAEVYGVEVLLVPSPCLRTGRLQTTVEVVGPPSALALFLYTADYVVAAAACAWGPARRRLGSAARRGFLLGVVHGFVATLVVEAPSLRQAGLVPFDGAVARAWRAKRHPRLRRTSISASNDAAWREGVEVGQRLEVRRALVGPSGGERLLVDTTQRQR